jgi:cytochrome c oxidase cbb3-type subunit 2
MLKHHDKIERNSILLLILTIIVISIGGIVEIVPLFRIETTIEKVDGIRPYTPLELIGAKIYKREGCYGCHSQQVRVLRDEVERYGHYSIAAESMYDYPFQWGSKRTGPDLARLGGKYSDEWHTRHLINPRDVVPESIMPGYKFLIDRDAVLSSIGDDMDVLRTLGVPYNDEMIQNAVSDGMLQASTDREVEGLLKRYGKKVNIRDFDGNANRVTEMDALVAYLQMLGTLVDFSNFEPIGYHKKTLKQKISDQKDSSQNIKNHDSNNDDQDKNNHEDQNENNDKNLGSKNSGKNSENINNIDTQMLNTNKLKNDKLNVEKITEEKINEEKINTNQIKENKIKTNKLNYKSTEVN